MINGDQLNGCRVYKVGDPNVWLVFQGQRHRIASPEIYIALFSETTALVESPNLFELVEGYELGEGTCLVKADGTNDRFLVVRTPDGIRKLHISSWETWKLFAFSEEKLRTVPDLILSEVAFGDPISSK